MSVKTWRFIVLNVPSSSHVFQLLVSQFNDLGLALECSHGFEVSKWVVYGVLPPRLHQDHSPSGEPHSTALV